MYDSDRRPDSGGARRGAARRWAARRVAGLALTLVAPAAGFVASAPAYAATPTATAHSTVAASAAATPAEAPEWTDCHERFECATLEVPLDYDKPRGPQASLAMIRYVTPDQANKIGSLFLNPGGPGASGVEFLATAPQFALDQFPKFDIVAWDPRGIGASTPAVDCLTDAAQDAAQGGYFTTSDTAYLRTLVRDARALLRGCATLSDPGALRHLSTADTARDLDRMRVAVGDARLNYIGMSHGTHIGAAYTSLFPGRTRAMVMDAPVDSDVWVNRPFESQRERMHSFERSLHRFFTACASAGEACGTWMGEDPERSFEELVARMNANPIPAIGAALPAPVTGDELSSVIASLLYSKFSWAFASTVIEQAAAGDGTLVRQSFLAGRNADGTWDPSGEFFTTTATDWRSSRRVEDYLAEGRHAEGLSAHFSFIAHSLDDVAYAFWSHQEDVYRGPFRHSRQAPPMLVIGGTHDPSTPYAWAKRYVAQLGNARLLTYEGDGHGSVTELTPCIVANAVAYVERLALPAEGTVCDQGFDDPFGVDSGARTQRTQQEPWPLPRTVSLGESIG